MRMYCGECQSKLKHESPQREGGAGADRFGSLQCQRCGIPLPVHMTPRALAEKLAQLARFGLADNRSEPRQA
jgi:hypothetical protein